MEIEFLGDIITGAMLFIVSGLSAYAFKFFKDRKKMIADNEKEIDKIIDDIERIERQCKKDAAHLRKAIVILAKRLDKKTKEAHPDIDTAFEEVTRDILTDEY